jgi:hypothetical protein
LNFVLASNHPHGQSILDYQLPQAMHQPAAYHPGAVQAQLAADSIEEFRSTQARANRAKAADPASLLWRRAN